MQFDKLRLYVFLLLSMRRRHQIGRVELEFEGRRIELILARRRQQLIAFDLHVHEIAVLHSDFVVFAEKRHEFVEEDLVELWHQLIALILVDPDSFSAKADVLYNTLKQLLYVQIVFIVLELHVLLQAHHELDHADDAVLVPFLKQHLVRCEPIAVDDLLVQPQRHHLIGMRHKVINDIDKAQPSAIDDALAFVGIVAEERDIQIQIVLLQSEHLS
mmetsp:Transcript_54532/g.87164  ORF Transcript_54532/g.87164 Transcript_54532/m.87164 type:complete len:216 (-) Transcript_54532:690-1337(-)